LDFNGCILSFCTFTSLEGLTGDGNACLNTNFKFTSNGINISQNDLAFGYYNRTNSEDNMTPCGVRHDLNNARSIIENNIAANSTRFRINSTNISTADLVDINGLIFAQRKDAITQYLHRNKVQISADAKASTGLPDIDFYFFATNSNGVIFDNSSEQLAMGFVSKSLSDAQRDIFYDAFQAYMTFNGKQV